MILRALAALFLLVPFVPSTASAAVSCSLTDFTVVSFDHGGTYLHGTLAGTPVIFITICGVNSSNTTDCTSAATNRNVAVALAAQAAGRTLEVSFWDLSSCSAFQPYTRAGSLRMLN